MSDGHSNQGPSLKGTEGQDIEPNRQEIDADRATSSSEYQEQHEFHDSKYWHAACRVRDCRLGFPECKVGSSCSKPGWKTALEEPLHRSRSLAPASKRLESVALLPSLLSNLPVTRTRSDPCIFGKDFLRITLPLPGEPSDCGAQGHAFEESESSAFACERSNWVGLGTREDNPLLQASGASSGNDGDESIHHIAGPRIDDTKEHRVPASDIVSSSKDKISQEFCDMAPTEVNAGLGEWCGDTSFDDTAMEGVSNSFRISRTPHWDDWWTCRSNECSEGSRHSGQRRMQYRNKSKKHHLASAEVIEMDQAEEEGSDEGYLVLEEQEDQQLGRFEDEGDCCDDGEEESIFYPKQYNHGDCAEEELPKGKMVTENGAKGYKDDDIWSDEHFVSSQVKGFPPPISILANETHPGLPGHMPRTLWRSVKRHGRFVLQEVQAQPREFFQATREFGRLRLQLVRPDSDPVGNYTEAVDMCNEDSAGAVSIACSRNMQNLAGISDTSKSEDRGIVDKGDMLGASTRGIDTLQPEDCWTAEEGAKLGVALDHDGSKLGCRLMSSTPLPNECGSVLEGEKTAGACSGQNCTVGVRLPSDAGLKEVPDLAGGDVTIEVSCVINDGHISEELQGGKMALGKTTIHIITYESRSPDSGQREVVKVSEAVKVDDREKPFGCCRSDDVQVLAAGIPLDTGHKPIVGQIDGERKVERMGVVNLCTKLDVGQVEEVEDLAICNVIMPPTVQGHDEHFRQDYQHPCFNTTYGFDSNLNVLSPSQTFMQFPIQPAVR